MDQTIRGNLAVQDSGFRPAGIVMGVATYQLLRPSGCMLGRGAAKSSNVLEYATYGEGVTRTWNDAIHALEYEAREHGAHGVAGVSATAEWISTSASTYQVQLIGNAVQAAGATPLERPFLSTLSMEQTLKMLLRGWVPSGIGIGIAAVHVHGFATSALWQRNLTTNAEMPIPTEGMQYVRRQAELRLRRSPTLRKAQGVIGVTTQLTYENEPCNFGATGMRLVGQLTGTGVARFGTPSVPIDVALSLSPRESHPNA